MGGYFTGNDASRRVMEKCGMQYLRFSPQEFEYLGEPRDLTYYAIGREDEAYPIGTSTQS